MNKITIPTFLVATVLIAGAFALMPVEKATTVHTTIQANTMKLVTVDIPHVPQLMQQPLTVI